MTEREIPENWPPARAGESQGIDGLSQVNQSGQVYGSGIPTTGSTSQSAQQQKQNSLEKAVSKDISAASKHKSKVTKIPGFLKSWVLWAVLLTFVPGTIAFMAMSMLLKLPSAPNCPSIFWPLASASVRIHCAQIAASKNTVNDLLQAISLVKHLPQNHPLRSEIETSLKLWSQEILELADESFQEGKIEQAIATARRIPDDMPAYKLVENKIADWRSTWSDANDIYKNTEDHLREARWQQAFMSAAKLLRLNNRYWTTIKYDELNNIITKSREDGTKLAQAEDAVKGKSIDKILQAIETAQAIEKDSYIYQKAQEAIPKFGRRMLELAKAKIEQKDADEAIYIAQKIPEIPDLQTEVEDFIALADAQRSAWTGSVSGLELAISQAQQIDSSRSNYQEAQRLISRWQLEIEDVGRLEKARTLALQGTLVDLNAAIAEAQLIPASNPRSREARREINNWRARVQTIEDRPYLDRADQLAILQDINSLEAAIAEASQIRRGRALYPEARRKVRKWRAKVQRIQDQPYLDRARAVARNGNLTEAINIAQQIGRGRALHGEAQRYIVGWRREIQARDNWQQAKAIAQRGTANSLSQAIRIARRIPRTSFLRTDANPAIEQWSRQILDIARFQGNSDIVRAIETARLVPRGTAAYYSARDQIRRWERLLNPEPEVTQPAVQEVPTLPSGEQEQQE
ncbi:chromosome segregation ATPase [Mastigocoleus sp. MO_188.B34]|uniref:chromosome segregation ATPase n=1 Tax=Mastigocoleus sp. MO_188.B34 TaxID=3036635 RepID=UPI00261EB8EB|nr:chromosome segregation ATPase [Mastigocoleus sp. MO_188.B34]MDJ0697455.1 chromosome segregation ATPase [Mastigocoleus sp. MO_188.B34]